MCVEFTLSLRWLVSLGYHRLNIFVRTQYTILQTCSIDSNHKHCDGALLSPDKVYIIIEGTTLTSGWPNHATHLSAAADIDYVRLKVDARTTAGHSKCVTKSYFESACSYWNPKTGWRWGYTQEYSHYTRGRDDDDDGDGDDDDQSQLVGGERHWEGNINKRMAYTKLIEMLQMESMDCSRGRTHTHRVTPPPPVSNNRIIYFEYYKIY